MAETLMRHLLYGIIVGTIAIMGVMFMLSELVSDSGNPEFFSNDNLTSLNRTFNKFYELNQSVQNFESGIQNSRNETQWGVFGVINGIIQSTWSVITGLFTSLGFFKDMLGSLDEYLPIPSWVGGALILIVLVLVGFGIFTIVFQKEA